jgi:uncharacterized damage-inducible protein DinB
MTPQPSGDVVQALEQSRVEFNEAAGGVPESQAKISPGAGRWSLVDCVEHVAMSEERFLNWLKNPEAEQAPPMNKQREGEMAARIASRETKVQAPEPVRPTGRFATLAQALEQFNTARADSIRFATERRGELYSLAAKHPFFGPVNGAEVMLLIAGHSRRHAAQMREIRAALPGS